MYRVIIAGSRDFDDRERLTGYVSWILAAEDRDDVEIVTGGARGADALGLQFANERSLRSRVFLADWSKHGKAAGPIRNKEMAAYGNVLIAFWDGHSRGTHSMILEALKAGLETHVYKI